VNQWQSPIINHPVACSVSFSAPSVPPAATHVLPLQVAGLQHGRSARLGSHRSNLVAEMALTGAQSGMVMVFTWQLQADSQQIGLVG
jgi:hypothetical protein